MISVHMPPSAVTAQPARLALTPRQSSYQAKLHPWCIVRLLPKMQRIVVGRFRKGNDADAHLRSLRGLIPQGRFIVMFDPGEVLASPSLGKTG